ncbi:agmatine deiminase family protein [Myxococcota bacterium]|nr:agmatine deiminase family protein [Myxococcota bacterium]
MDAAHGSAWATPWTCDPDLYGFTGAPTSAATLPNESQSTTGVLLAWPQWGCTVQELVDLIRAALGHTDVTIIVPAEFQPSAEECLRRSGVSDEARALVEWLNLPVDSIWIRDYGPETVVDANGRRALIDASYFPRASRTCHNLLGRADDDALPTRLGELLQLPVHRPQAIFEGGNLLSDGAGRCFRARRFSNYWNQQVWGYSEAQLDAVLGANYGCQVTAMESLEGGVIDHIDMWMALLSHDTVLVGEYALEDDATNAAILDRNAAQLAGMGYRVVRIPMPAPWCVRLTASCLAQQRQMQPCGDPDAERVWATYTNSIRVGDRMVVPVYSWAPEDVRARVLAQQDEALRIYRQELDRIFGAGAVEVVPVQSDAIIPCQGTFHCISMTYR